MNIDNLKSQMRKGMLEFCVLLLLRRGDAYASEIIARMKDAHLIVMEGTLYPLLTRLKNDGLLSYRWEESPSGPPRKYYCLTPWGEQCLLQLHGAWNEISRTVDHLIAIQETPRQSTTPTPAKPRRRFPNLKIKHLPKIPNNETYLYLKYRRPDLQH